jgi:hypothetical protein
LNDAVEQLATTGYNIPTDLDNEINNADATDHVTNAPSDTEHTECDDDNCPSEGMFYYASIRVKASE